MAICQARALYSNLVQASGTTLTASSESTAGPVDWLQDQLLSKAWRAETGWRVTQQVNDEIIVNEGGIYRIGYLTPGTYASGAALATEVQTALTAARSGYLPFASTPNLSAWYRADTLVTSLADGATVTTWNDQGPNGYHLNAAVAGTSLPTFTRSGPNGRPAVRFANANSISRASVPFGTLFSAAALGTTFVVFWVDSDASGSDVLWMQNGSYRGQYWSGGNAVSRAYDGTNDEASKAAAAGAWHIATWLVNATGVFVSVDDADAAAIVTTATGAQTQINTTDLMIGSDGTNHLKGYIAEMLFFNAVYSEALRRQVQEYLVQKYAITDATTDATWTNTYAASYSSTTKLFTINRSAGAATMELPWASLTQNTRSIGRDMGFSPASDDTGATTYSSDVVTYKSRSWVLADLGSAQAVTVGAIMGHSLGASGTVTLYGNTVDSWTSPAVTQTLTGNSDIRIAYFSSQSYRYWLLMIDDVSSATTGYTDVGIWYLGTYAQTGVGYGDAFTKRHRNLSVVTLATHGAPWQDLRPHQLEWSLNWFEVPDADRAILETWIAELPRGTAFLFSFDAVNTPTDTYYVYIDTDVEVARSPLLYWTVPVTLAQALG